MLNTMTDAVTETAVIIPQRGLNLNFSGIMDTIASLIEGANRIMPATDANESWRLTLLAAIGLLSSISESATDSAVIGSFSRYTTGANKTIVCINAARTADGLAPTARANIHTTAIETIAPLRLLPINI